MKDLDQFKEVCDLLKIWFYLKENKFVWPDVTNALEVRINNLLEQ